MHTWLPWLVVTIGLSAGAIGACVPGFPGAALALVGLAAYAALTGFEVVGRDALLLATLLALAGGTAQLLSPVWGVRLLSRATGASTGAVVGATAGLLVPAPLGGLVLGTLGSFLGVFVGRGSLGARLAALPAILGTTLVAVTVDLLAVLGIGAVLAIAEFAAG